MRYAEGAWERIGPAPAVDDAFLDLHLAPWPELRRRRWSVLGGGLRHVNLRSEDVVARIAVLPGSSVKKEGTLLRRMAGRVRVPRVVGESRTVLLLEHVPHEELPATADAAARAGEALRRVHDLPAERGGIVGDDGTVTEPFDDVLAALLAWGEPGLGAGADAGRRLGPLADRVRRAWRGTRPALAAACARPTFLHGDFKPANVKWLPTERDVLVLDWEFAWHGPAWMDVGQFLRWEGDGPVADAFLRAAVPGSDAREVRRVAALLDLFNLVGLLDRAGSAPVRERDLLGRIRATLEEEEKDRK